MFSKSNRIVIQHLITLGIEFSSITLFALTYDVDQEGSQFGSVRLLSTDSQLNLHDG